LETHGFKPLDSSSEKLLKGQIVEIVKEDHKIRQLVRKLTLLSLSVQRFFQFRFK